MTARGRRADGRQERAVPLRGDRVRAEHREGRDQPRHRPVLRRADLELDALGGGGPATTRRSSPSCGARRRRRSWRRTWTPRSTSCTCATSRSATRPCRRSTAGPTWRSRRTATARKHLKALADAGLNTVHLLPTFDIASIEEDPAKQATPDCDLASYAPDSERAAGLHRDGRAARTPSTGATTRGTSSRPRARTPRRPRRPTAARGSPSSAPWSAGCTATACGSCSTRCSTTRAASGQDAKSVLDQVVPGYYHRLNATGAVETSTCCQNIATEHAMAQKLMVDSVVLWARDYKVDGFRFDLMGHHSRDEHARGAGRARRAHAEARRRRREVGLPLRRGLELRRGGEQRAASPRPPRASSAARGSAPSPTGCATPSAAAARSTRTRASRASAAASSPTTTATDINDNAGRVGSSTTPTWCSSAWPATCARSRSAATRSASRGAVTS